MIEHVPTFLKAVAVVPLTLLPIINPLSGAPVFLLTAGPQEDSVRRLARQVALNCWWVLVVSMLIGSYVLDLFGISLPIVRIGGGLIVASVGWKMLHSKDDDDVRRAVAESAAAGLGPEDIVRKSFYPITFPLTTGPGTIAAAIALGTKSSGSPLTYVAGMIIAVIGATLTAGVVFLVYRNSGRILGRMGPVGTLVMMRLMAFVLLCIGIEILWAGWQELARS